MDECLLVFSNLRHLLEKRIFIRETVLKSPQGPGLLKGVGSRVGTKPTEAVRLFYSIVNYNQIVIGKYLLILYIEVLSMTMVELTLSAQRSLTF